MPDSQLLQERLQSPPSTTRAHLRGSVIRQHYAKQCHLGLSVDWAVITHGEGFYAKLSNPFLTKNHRVEQHFGIDSSAA
jgi:hypothetical protein